ncbi:TAXI family TRAP transporter solute-binding subunit [Paracoccus albus]|uniref:TAXI family TRAP transporter solute-binding subunit n=1 Tax=Paracoccus albus TaxID=3017784 RepID=UPI0022F04579|nr:TAXI family TRAP transporter solute-binding subunit [Paracoccus albus]WBU59268.1 TAXI family TRAP transporter solute-binding subunit [Paracoccus albus]
MKSIIRNVTIAAAMTVAATHAVSADTLSVEGAAPASLTGLVPQTLATYAAEEGVDLQVVLGQTLTKSGLKVAAGQTDMAVVPPIALAAMKQGTGPYAAQGEQAAELHANLRSLFGFPGGAFHVIAWADSGIDSWDDLSGKRVYIGAPAGSANLQIRGMIEQASGLKDGEDYEGIRAPWAAAQQAFQDGQFDVFIPAVAVGQQSLNELSLQREIRILGLPDDVVGSDGLNGFVSEAGLTVMDIPAGTYSGQANGDEDLKTISTTMTMAVNQSMTDDNAYALTKAYWDNLDDMKAQNMLLRPIDEEQPFLNLNVPLHPGAARYYEEQGIEIPDSLRPAG